MASEQPAVIHMTAGADYLAALQKLGLDPECLFWAEDQVVAHPVLVLVSRQFDRAGPLSLSRLLFKAYNAAATPQEIDPFILRLHSPEQTIIHELTRVIGYDIRVEPNPGIGSLATVHIQGGGLKFEPSWIYKWKISSKKPSSVVMSRQWRRFADRVEKLAA